MSQFPHSDAHFTGHDEGMGPGDRAQDGQVALRPMRADDWEAIHAFAGRPEVYLYQAWEPNTAEQTRDYVAEAAAAYGDPSQTQFYLSAARPDEHIIGLAQVTIHSSAWRCAEIGYQVHPDHWGRGYGTRIAWLAVDYAFGELGMHRVEATCDPRNTGSVRILGKVGMTHEGTLRHTMRLRDGWRDSHMFSVLEDEWRSRVR
jgi:[ribosomal protein S5]-alanine N-acetyltransferase